MIFKNRIITADNDVCMAPESWGMHEVVIDRAEACEFMATLNPNLEAEEFKKDFADYRDWGYELYEHLGKFYVVDTTADMYCETNSPLVGVSGGMVACVGDWDFLSNFGTEEN